MIIDGFIRKQLPPAPPEVEAKLTTATAKSETDAAADAIEMYLALGTAAKAHLINGKITLVQYKITAVH